MTDEIRSKRELREVLRRQALVCGVVQGVGFRPFVYRIAMEEGVTGFIGNDTDGVTIEIEGPGERVEAFLVRLRAEAPPLARIDSVAVRELGLKGDEAGFRIVSSEVRGLPAGAARPEGSALPVSVFELHQLRAALHYHPAHSLRPAADFDGPVSHVPGLPAGV